MIVVRPFVHGSHVSLIEQAFGNSELQTSGSSDSSRFVAVGDEINVENQDGYLRGHGTYLVDGKLIATLCGVVERVNKLVYVRPLKSRYTAEQGDVVVGRVTEIAGKRWKVDLKTRQEAGLLLSAVNLPGGIQRRRNAEDELNMRSFFREGDLISAEVQQVMYDGGVALHTRSIKYGKLTVGQLLTVPASLVKRQKQHFVSMQAIGVDVILGCNGLIWVSPTPVPAAVSEGSDARSLISPDDGTADGLGLPSSSSAGSCARLTRQQVEASTRVANCIRALASLYLLIYPATIMDAYEIAVEQAVPLKELLEADFLLLLVKSEAIRRSNSVV